MTSTENGGTRFLPNVSHLPEYSAWYYVRGSWHSLLRASRTTQSNTQTLFIYWNFTISR